MAISVSGCHLNKFMVFRDFLLAFMSLLLTFSIILHTAFAHFCRPLLEGAGIFVLRNNLSDIAGTNGCITKPNI